MIGFCENVFIDDELSDSFRGCVGIGCKCREPERYCIADTVLVSGQCSWLRTNKLEGPRCVLQASAISCCNHFYYLTE